METDDAELTAVMSELTVVDPEHVDVEGIDVKSANQGGTEDTITGAVETAPSNIIKCIAGESVDANGNEEDDGKLEIADAAESSEPSLADAAESSEPSLADAAESSEPSLADASEISDPSLADASEISDPSLADASEISEPSLADPSEISEPSLADASEISEPSFVDAAEISEPSFAESAEISEPSFAESAENSEALLADSAGNSDSIEDISTDPLLDHRSFLKDYVYEAYGGFIEIPSVDYSELAEDTLIPMFLRRHTCWDIMPEDTGVGCVTEYVEMDYAFRKLFWDGIKAIPVWDQKLSRFIGMFTITDFVKVLRHYYHLCPDEIRNMEDQTLRTWREVAGARDRFVKVDLCESLFQVTRLLIHGKIHRIPVISEDPSNVSFVITKRRLLHFLHTRLFNQFGRTNIQMPRFFIYSIGQLHIGTYENIATINIRAKVIDALGLFVTRNVSSLPVVNNNNVLVDIFDKHDVLQLVKGRAYRNLDIRIGEAIRHATVRESVWEVTIDCTLAHLIHKVVDNAIHRVVVINDERKVIGIVSLSDILKYLALVPLETIPDEEGTSTALDFEQFEGANAASAMSDNIVSLEIEHIF